MWGTKTLRGGKGTIEILFIARITPTSELTSIAEGFFVVVGGTGEYEDLRASGRTSVTLDLSTGTVKGVYSGRICGMSR